MVVVPLLTTIIMIVQLMMLMLMVMLMIVPLVVVVRQHFLTSRPATSSVFCSPVVAIASPGGPQERTPFALSDLRALTGGAFSSYPVLQSAMFVMAA